MEYITEFNRLKHHIITNYGQPNWLLLVRGTGLTLHDPRSTTVKRFMVWQ